MQRNLSAIISLLLSSIIPIVVFSLLATTVYVVSGFFSTNVPKVGGTLVEGVVGSPLVLDPIAASSETDKALVVLLFEQLFSTNDKGELEPVIALDYEVSEEAVVVTIRDDHTFHDGSPVTARDVVATFNRMRDPLSQHENVGRLQNVQAIANDDTTVTFTVESGEEYVASQYILPLLDFRVTKAFNEDDSVAIGSGPYRYHKTVRNSDDSVRELQLVATKGEFNSPYIKRLVLRFYNSLPELQLAIAAGEVDTAVTAALPELSHAQLTLHRSYGVFFNTTRTPFMTTESRLALADMIENIDFNDIVTGTPSRGYWLLPEVLNTSTLEPTVINASFEIATTDNQVLTEIANVIADTVEEAGGQVTVTTLPTGDFINQKVRNRDFDVILFGVDIEDDIELSQFWHSDEINDPGLNISGFNNEEVDVLLDNLIQESDTSEQQRLRENFAILLESERPSVFLLHPTVTYVFPEKLQNVVIDSFAKSAAERFLHIESWYLQTERLYK